MELKIVKRIDNNLFLSELGELYFDQGNLSQDQVYELDTDEEFIVGETLMSTDQEQGLSVSDNTTYIVGVVDEIIDPVTAILSIKQQKWLFQYQGDLKKEKMILKASHLKFSACNY